MPYVLAGGVNESTDGDKQKGENRIKDKTLINFMLRKDMAFNMLHHELYLWLAEHSRRRSRRRNENRKKSILNHWKLIFSCTIFCVNVKSRNEKLKEGEIIVKMNCWHNFQWLRDEINLDVFMCWIMAASVSSEQCIHPHSSRCLILHRYFVCSWCWKMTRVKREKLYKSSSDCDFQSLRFLCAQPASSARATESGFHLLRHFFHAHM